MTAATIASLVFFAFSLAAALAVEFLLTSFAKSVGLDRLVFVMTPALLAMLYSLIVYQNAERKIRRVGESVSRGILVMLMTWVSLSALITWAWYKPGEFGSSLGTTLLASGVAGGDAAGRAGRRHTHGGSHPPQASTQDRVVPYRDNVSATVPLSARRKSGTGLVFERGPLSTRCSPIRCARSSSRSCRTVSLNSLRGSYADRTAVQRRRLPEDRERARRCAARTRHRTRPHDLLSAGRRPAGRHGRADPRRGRAHRYRRHAQGGFDRQRAAPPGVGIGPARARRDLDAGNRLAAPLRADAAAHRAARNVVRNRCAGDRRQYRPRQGPPRFRHRHQPARRGQDRARHERADRTRGRDEDGLDHR